MAALIYLDSHVATWLFAARTDLLSRQAIDLIEREDLYISPMVRLELEYLREIGRLSPSSHEMVGTLSEKVGLQVCDLPFSTVAEHAAQQRWTRDPFDRLIVGNAAAREARLLTRDETIRANYSAAVW